MAERLRQQGGEQDTQAPPITPAVAIAPATAAATQSAHAQTQASTAAGRGREDESESASPADRFFTPDWFLPRYYIDHCSPSRRDGIDLAQENLLRRSYSAFLQMLGKELHMPQLTIATAIVFCHRFFLRQSHARNDRYIIASICMFLAGKVEETPERLHNVIFLSYEMINNKDPSAAERIKEKDIYERQKELMLVGERLVLTTLGFELNVHHPYKPLVATIKKFKLAEKELARMAQIAWNFVNDGLQTSLSLQYRPSHVAAGAIFLAAKFLKVKLPFEGESFWLQEFKITPQQLEDVSNQLLEFYDPPKGGPALDASIPSVGLGVNSHVYVGANSNHGFASEAPPTKLQVADTSANMEGQEGHQQFYYHEKTTSSWVGEGSFAKQEDVSGRRRYTLEWESKRSFDADLDLKDHEENGYDAPKNNQHLYKYSYCAEDGDSRYTTGTWLAYEEDLLERERKHHLAEHDWETQHKDDQDDGYYGRYPYSSSEEVGDWTSTANPWPNYEEEYSERDWKELPESAMENGYKDSRCGYNRKRRFYSSCMDNGDWRSNSKSWAGFDEERHGNSGFRDDPSDTRYRHNIQSRGYHSHHHRHPRRDDARVDYQQYRFRGWQERDPKRARYEHGAN